MPINNKHLNEVEGEIRRYRKAVAALRDREKNCQFWVCHKETGAIRRASMDLTRALTRLRKWTEE